MGLRLEVIQYHDEANQSLVQRIPADGTADIKYGAQLIVGSAQEAIFFRDGRAMDSFGPGRHTLTTQNVPFLTRILTIPWEKSPFQACVYFIGKQTFIDQKWGTRQPIAFRDKDFGAVRLRSFGKYSFRVVDAALLLNTLVGSQGKYTTDEIVSFQKDVIVSKLTDLLGAMNPSLLDLPSRYDEIASGVRAKVAEDFGKYGLELVDLFINAITPPDEVQKAIDARGSMGVIGDLNSYMRYQTAKSLGKMSESGQVPGSLGMGVGFGMGMAIPGMMAGGGNTGPLSGSPMPTPQPSAFPQSPGQSGGLPPLYPGAAAAGKKGERPEFGQLARETGNPAEIVTQAAEAAGYALQNHGDEIVMTVPIGTLRKQQVTALLDRKDEEGHAIVSFRSTCGPVTEKNALTLLRFNGKMVYGAFAVAKLGESESLVIQANLPADMLNPLAVTQVVGAVAWQADQVEEKLSGLDVY
ncbi:MAG: SPFH domain-containing protein [Pirellulales bacterium]